MSRCRSCDAPIVWARTVTGKTIPLDFAPSATGEFTIERDADGVKIAVWFDARRTGDESSNGPEDLGVHAAKPVKLRYSSHFATCPHAAAHRKVAR